MLLLGNFCVSSRREPSKKLLILIRGILLTRRLDHFLYIFKLDHLQDTGFSDPGDIHHWFRDHLTWKTFHQSSCVTIESIWFYSVLWSRVRKIPQLVVVEHQQSQQSLKLGSLWERESNYCSWFRDSKSFPGKYLRQKTAICGLWSEGNYNLNCHGVLPSNLRQNALKTSHEYDGRITNIFLCLEVSKSCLEPRDAL